MHRSIYISRQIKHMSALLAVLLLVFVVIAPTLAYLVTMTPPLINTFVSGLEPEGDLVIRKVVEHPFGDGYVIPEDLEFEFRVDLGDSFAGKSIRTTQGEKTADSNGHIFLKVKPGSSVGISDLIVGTDVIITELQPGAGFEVKGGEKSKTVTICAMEETVVTYINCYSPECVTAENVMISGVKNLIGRDWQAEDSFTFQLDWRFMGDKDSDWACLGTKTITYESGVEDFNCFDMTDLLQGVNLERFGTYAFRVTEVDGTIGGITYDDAIGYFDIVVSDADMDGALEIGGVNGMSNVAVSHKDNRYQVAVEFTNHYAPAGSAEVRIPILKTLTDKSGQNKTPSGFVFGLYDLQGTLVGRSEPTSAAGETCIKLVYDAASAGQTIRYTLREVSDGQPGMQYDSTAYEVTVVVTDNLDGTISAASSSPEVKFENIYDPQDADAQISGSKELIGRAMEEEEFQFDLYQTGENFVVGMNDHPIETATNDAQGSFSFNKLTFEQVGSYYYVVKENASADLGGVTYDETVYLVTISVTDQNGVLTAQYTVTDCGGKETQIRFRNVYKAERVSVHLDGAKELQGAELEAEMFRFELYAADDEFAAQGDPIEVVTNDADGIFTFDTITYDAAGVYHYLVMENIPEYQDSITYDETVFGVTVMITDDGYGALTADIEYAIVGGDATDKIWFKNIYTGGTTDPTVPDSPPTGDMDQTLLWGILLTACVALVILSLMDRPRKKRFDVT